MKIAPFWYLPSFHVKHALSSSITPMFPDFPTLSWRAPDDKPYRRHAPRNNLRQLAGLSISWFTQLREGPQLHRPRPFAPTTQSDTLRGYPRSINCDVAPRTTPAQLSHVYNSCARTICIHTPPMLALRKPSQPRPEFVFLTSAQTLALPSTARPNTEPPHHPHGSAPSVHAGLESLGAAKHFPAL